MKAIMISIKPEWVEKILNGDKTIEIRKTMPKCELPCKVYIYCTKGKNLVNEFGEFIANNKCYCYPELNGKVVAEFTLNKITKHEKNYIDVDGSIVYNFKTFEVAECGFETDIKSLCDFDWFVTSYGGGKALYAWHIDNLKIYDKPKNINSFIVSKVALDCGYGNYNIYNKVLSRPPQSWCYVKGE